MPTRNSDIQKQQLKERGICVIIPTYNNALSIEKVVTETLEQCEDVIVVNDGSTDETAEILSRITGITVIAYENNHGKGYALKKGFRKAKAMGFAYAITLDADGQHYPASIPSFLEANKKYPGALIMGSRQMEEAERSRGSRFANKFSNFWFFVQTGKRLADTQTGYRLYPLCKLWGMRWLPNRYEAELGMIVFAAWHGVKLKTIPIHVYYPPKEERVSHFRPVTDFVRISLLNTVLCLLAVIYGLPLFLWRQLKIIARTAYALVFFVIFTIFIATPAIWLYIKIGGITEKKRIRLHQLIYYFSRFVAVQHGIPGVKFSLHVAEDVDFNTPHVIICNHQSHIDLVYQLIFTQKIIFLTKDWVWNNLLYGYLIRNAEYLTVSKGIDELLPRLHSLVERGYSIAVYPEGTRSKDCEIARFHKGAFYIAEQLNLPILPMYLYGTGRVLPKSTYHLRPGRVHIEVGSPKSQEAMKELGDLRQQTKWMHRHYIRMYDKLRNKLDQYV